MHTIARLAPVIPLLCLAHCLLAPIGLFALGLGHTGEIAGFMIALAVSIPLLARGGREWQVRTRLLGFAGLGLWGLGLLLFHELELAFGIVGSITLALALHSQSGFLCRERKTPCACPAPVCSTSD